MSEQEKQIRYKLNQLWSWAKAGKSKENYLMSVENVDSFTDNVMELFNTRLIDELISFTGHANDIPESVIKFRIDQLKEVNK